MGYIHLMDYVATKGTNNEYMQQHGVRMSKNIILNKKSQTQSTTYGMITFI